MNKKIISLLLLLCFSLSCFSNVAFASSIPDSIDGPASVLKPMDGSFTKVKYTLLDDEGEPIDNSLVTWSASGGLVISEDGYIILGKNTPDGTYTINAVVGGISAPAKTITVKSGAYLTDTYTSGTINMLSTGFTDDCNFEFDFSAASSSNSAAFFLKILNDSNWHFPVYLRSHATNYKFRFDDYSGTNGENKRNEYTTSYAYGTTQTIRVSFDYDEDMNYIGSYDVYLNESPLDLFQDCVVMSKGNLNFLGIRELTIRNTISMKNIKLYSGEKINPNDSDYKYVGVALSGEDTLSSPRKSDYLTSQYDVENVFGASLNNEATWKVTPEGNGVTVSSDGLVSVTKGAVGGDYTLTATVGGNDYSKVIEVSSVEYKLVISGRTEYVRDFTHVPNQLVSFNGGFSSSEIIENYTATDQMGEPVVVNWTLEGASAFSYNLTTSSNSVGVLKLPSSFPDGTYTLKATADPSEGIDDPVATLTIVVKPATYEIVGPDTIVVSNDSCNSVKYELLSSLGNTYENSLEWQADNAVILNDGNLISSDELPSSFNISLNTKVGTYTKSVTVTNQGTVTGTNLDATLEYTGSNKFPLQNGVNEKLLTADLVAGNGIGTVDNSFLNIEWEIVEVAAASSDGSAPVADIQGSKIVINGKQSGSVTVQGKLKYTPFKTVQTVITLTDAFAAVNGSVLNIKGTSGETFTVNHYKPATESFVDAVFGTVNTPVTSNAQIAQDAASVNVSLDFSKSGMHKIIVVNSSNDVNEFTVMIDDDKLFYQSDIKTLLTNARINEYLKKYTTADISLIEECSNKYSLMTSEQKDAVLLLTNKNKDYYFVSVKLIEFLSSDSTETDSIKAIMADAGIDSSWIDVLKTDSNRLTISQNVISNVSSLETIADTVILQAVKNSSISNPKEAKPYLSLCGSAKYDKANDTQRNTIARAVVGKTFDTMQMLLSAIDAVNISQTTQSGGGSSGGGSTQTGSIGGFSPVVTPVPNPVVPGANQSIYADVSLDHWAYSYVKTLSEKGIVNGFDGNVFMPDANVTRAEFVKMLVEAFAVTKTFDEPFTDVDSSDWYSQYVASAYGAGLVMGDGQNFRPNENITRQDAAVMIHRFAIFNGYEFSANDNSFADKNLIADYANDSINALLSASIISGMPDGTFAPVNSTTRAEAAKLIYGILNKGGIR